MSRQRWSHGPRTGGVLACCGLLVALAACSAGQVTQTAGQTSSVTGSSAEVGDLQLRDIELGYPTGGRYEEGDSAPLLLAIANRGQAADTLIEVSGSFFDSATGTGPEDEVATGAGDTGGEDSEVTDGVAVEIGAGSLVLLGGDEADPIELLDLNEGLYAGQIVDLTFTFAEAGEVSVSVPVGNSDRETDRGEPFDYHGEE